MALGGVKGCSFFCRRISINEDFISESREYELLIYLYMKETSSTSFNRGLLRTARIVDFFWEKAYRI
jgi:hypothetical protein